MDETIPSLDDAQRVTPFARWEYCILAIAAVVALLLGFANLGAPSVWHDESVHIYVAQSILKDAWPHLPSGQPYVSGVLYSLLLSGFIAVFGESEAAVRAPSVLIAAGAVILIYLLIRRLLGKNAAAVSAVFLAFSPWTVAWSRQARFYGLQESLYIAFLLAFCWALAAPSPGATWRRMVLPFFLYILGLFTALHSVMFLGPVVGYAFVRAFFPGPRRRQWIALFALATAVGIATVVLYRLSLPTADVQAIFPAGKLGGNIPDPSFDRDRSPRLYYFIWLKNNLSAGYLLLALLGTVVMLVKEGWRGFIAALAFWAPLFALTYLIGYRRERFMYFAYPFYVAAHSYALVWLIQVAASYRRSWFHSAVALAILLFTARIALTTARLFGDSIDTARGSNVTLAVVHPQWKKPCRYILAHRDGAAVLSTSYMPALYYLGAVDNWYPSGVLLWEYWESGLHGLATLDDLKSFVAAHPKGYFLAEIQRFSRWKFFAEDQRWVDSHMTRLDAASGEDVILYSWGMN